MRQEYDKYTAEDKEVWNILYHRQKKNLQTKACWEYLRCLDRLDGIMNEHRIPDFSALNTYLLNENGWSVAVVPGLIPVGEFFRYLSKKQFCSSTWLRKMSELDYLEEPDMFHDTFGHIPLLLIDKYANYMEEIGKLGVKYKDNDKIVLALQRLYWFTIEFGLVESEGKSLIYGAGIISSFGESNHTQGEGIERIPFSLSAIFNNDFINSEIQTKYYVLPSMEFLYDTIYDLEKALLAFDNQ